MHIALLLAGTALVTVVMAAVFVAAAAAESMARFIDAVTAPSQVGLAVESGVWGPDT